MTKQIKATGIAERLEMKLALQPHRVDASVTVRLVGLTLEQARYLRSLFAENDPPFPPTPIDITLGSVML